MIVSPVSSAPRPSEPAGQCSTAAPSKCPPMRARVVPRTGSASLIEQLDAGRRALDPVLVGARDEDAGVERVGKVDAGPVEVRMRHADRVDAAGVRDLLLGRRSSSREMQSHSTLPPGVRTSSARCPIANAGSTPTPVRPGSSSRSTTAWSRPSSAMVVQRWPPQPTYWRSSSQMGQAVGGWAVSGYCTPQVAQIQAGIGRSPFSRCLSPPCQPPDDGSARPRPCRGSSLRRRPRGFTQVR